MPATTSATMWLTSAVIASLVTSIIDIIIHIFDNHKLTRIEKEKRMNELTTYRYTKLFDMLLKWKEYDTDFKTEGKNPSQIATDRVFKAHHQNVWNRKLL